jgi:transposase-like protein
MAMTDKYSIKDLQKQFPTDEACLQFIFENRHSKDCSCGGTYRKISGRKQYQCSKCRFQIAPTAGTIFHKSDTPLTDWFFALFVVSNAKSGISAKQLERELGCTYKTAWRILSKIREALTQDNDRLDGTVEMDVAYLGGRFRSGKDNKRQKEAIKAKTVVMGAVARGGELRLKVVSDATAQTINAFLETNVAPTARLITDDASTYTHSASDYYRDVVKHKETYSDNGVHINNIETVWGHIKRSLKGIQKGVSKQEMQSYLDLFAFHYNNRHSDKMRFGVLLGTVLRDAK